MSVLLATAKMLLSKIVTGMCKSSALLSIFWRLISLSSTTSTGGTVTIKSDYGTSAIKAKIDEVDAEGKKTGKKIDAELVPKADIEINGNVEAENGVVTVEDKNYNILLQGEGSRTAEVNGKEIHLTAGKSISQGFTQGIVNIGGNPEELYKNKYFNSDVNDFNGTYGYETTRRIHDEDRTHDEMLTAAARALPATTSTSTHRTSMSTA